MTSYLENPLLRDAHAAAPELAVLPIDAVRIDPGVHPRNEINERTVAACARALANGETLSLPLVFKDGDSYLLVDGHARWEAHRRSGANTVECKIALGDRRAAIANALFINASHGQSLRPREKRRGLDTLLDDPENHRLSDYHLGQICGYSHTTVGRLRKLHPLASTFASDGVRLVRNKHGKRNLMNTKRIGSTPRRRDCGETNGSSQSAPRIDRALPEEPIMDWNTAALPGRGSLQLRLLLAAFRNGKAVQEAAEIAEISLEEAKLHLAAEARGELSDIALPQWVIARALGGSQALLPHEEMLGTRGAAQVASITTPTLLLEKLDGDDPLACLGQLEAAALTDPQRFARALSALGDPGLETRLGAVIVWLGTVAETFRAAQAQGVPACYEETACAE